MKNILFACLFTLMFSSAFGQDQWTLFSKVTADWCPNCGTYGWTMMEDGMEAIADKNVLVLNLHHSGGLTNPVASEIVDNFQTFSQPRFFINNDDMSVSSGNVSAKVDELVETVDLLNSFAPFATVSSSAIYNGTAIETASNVEFLETIDGNYYLATYLIRDNIVHNQASQGANAVHPFVLMDAISASTFGTEFATPAGMSGTTFSEDLTYEIEIDDADLDDYYVATIVWNFLETTETYRFFNATRTKIVNQSSASNDTELFETYKLALNNQVLDIQTTGSENYTLTVMATDGKVISQGQYNGSTSIDMTQVNHQMVVVNITEGKLQATKRFVLH